MNARLVRTTVVAVLCVAASAVAGAPLPAGASSSACPHGSDFDNDGRDDLVVGAPGDDVVHNGSSLDHAGAVAVLMGSASGVSTTDRLWSLESAGVPGTPAKGDRWGSAVATGDFNDDGFDDLAVGAPNRASSKGVVSVIYGSASGLGSVVRAPQYWSQDSSSVEGVAEAGDRFGATLAAGDFNGDGKDDLAVGAPGEDDGATVDAGAVNLLYGAANGLSATSTPDAALLEGSPLKDSPGASESLGQSMAACDFNQDGNDDLAIGVAETVSTFAGAGGVHVVLGNASGLGGGGTSTITLLTESTPFLSTVDATAAGERFGRAVAAGDYNGDSYGDLAIGSDENPGGLAGAGALNVIYGSPTGITVTLLNNSVFTESDLTHADTSEAGDRFGAALVAGDFDGANGDDLAIGIPSEGVGGVATTGAMSIMLSSGANGLAAANDVFVHQNSAGIPGSNEAGDRFGGALSSGDFNDDGKDDLVIGSPRENVGSVVDAGAVTVTYGLLASPARTAQSFTQDSSGIVGTSATSDYFGNALGAGGAYS